MKLLVGTTNRGKLREFEALLAPLGFEVCALSDVAIDTAVDEDRDTFLGNAERKAVAYATRAGMLALADDSGLEVDALGGAPGVRSARYAGEGATDATNVEKLLAALAGRADRGARFRCALVVAGADGHVLATAEGTFEGRITDAPRGAGGFGYDPVFGLLDDPRTAAELPAEEKHARSHRGAALRGIAPQLAALRAAPRDATG